MNLLNIAQQMTHPTLLEATRTQWCQTTMLAVFVASDTKSIAQVRKTASLSAAIKPGQSMYSSKYLFCFPPNFLCAETTALFCSFRASSFETTGFLPPLHTSLGRILDQTEMVDGNNLETEILIMLNLKQLN